MQLPIGYDNFKEIVDKKLNFVDKTLFIKEIFDDKGTQAIVITRPRRFGKTLNLSLLHYFLAAEVYGQLTEGLFKGLEITRCEGEYMQHQGKYPVVSVTFKDIRESNHSSACEMLAKLMSRAYREHRYLLMSDKLAPDQKEIFTLILEEKASEASLKMALFDLTYALYLYYEIKPWLLIDEYDTPIHAAYVGGYYDEMIQFMRGLFGAVLKNNPYLNKAVITGILRIAKESLFSGVNNLKVYSILHDGYSEHFGFTETEVNAILAGSHLVGKAAEIKDWYNGYQFGGTTIYNPWSIANCIKEKGGTEPYWINTSDNQLIKKLLKDSPLDFKTQFENLMRGETTEQLIDDNMVFADLETNSLAVWSLLLMSGYLTPVVCEKTWNDTLCHLRVPNREVNNLYRQIIVSWLANGYGFDWYRHFTTALISGQIDTLREYLNKILLEVVSYHDLAKEPEIFFHGLLLGFIASLQETHEIKSNRESGLGRYDIMLIPKERDRLGIVIDLKAKRANQTQSLETLAKIALDQIDEKQYATEFKPRGISRILKIAIAFEGKLFALCSEEKK